MIKVPIRWFTALLIVLLNAAFHIRELKVTEHPFWRFVKNRYCALKISPIFIKFSPNVSQCMQNMTKL
jgi:hypothetical protein